MLCRTLDVSESGYYAWTKRALSARAQANALYADRIEEIYRYSRSTYVRKIGCAVSIEAVRRSCPRRATRRPFCRSDVLAAVGTIRKHGPYELG
jgi:hypothetical protein